MRCDARKLWHRLKGCPLPNPHAASTGKVFRCPCGQHWQIVERIDTVAIDTATVVVIDLWTEWRRLRSW